MTMHEPGKSDRPVVPTKPAKSSFWDFYQEHVERVEGRGLAKENGQGQALPPADPAKQVDRTQSRVSNPGAAGKAQDLHSELDRVRQAACRDKQLKFTSLWRHVYDIDRLREAYLACKHDAAAGVDGQTWQAYGQERESNLKNLSDRLAQGRYRAKPVRRVYIPKADGRQRPIGVPVLEDKIVQRATVQVLNAVYETDFLGFSYGFRPGRSAHMALDALAVAIRRRKVSYVLDADIRSFFDTISHEWLMQFVGHRIADQRVLRHIQKWLNAGVLEDGKRVEQEEGTPQGGSISPLLANLYLHHVLDLWAEQWRRTRAGGDVVIVRYADDFVVGFEHLSDARRFLEELAERFRRFNLELHADKTRILEFGRFAAQRRQQRGEGKPMTFNFLGFTHACDKTRDGRFIVLRRTMALRMRAKLRSIKQELRKRLHHPVAHTGQWLAAVLRGYYRYFGVPRNGEALNRFRLVVWRLWRRSLGRRSQKGRLRRERYEPLADRWLALPRVCQPYPEQRLAVLIQGKSPVR
jgi:group II intron reverse transcriptase/maturase